MKKIKIALMAILLSVATLPVMAMEPKHSCAEDLAKHLSERVSRMMNRIVAEMLNEAQNIATERREV